MIWPSTYSSLCSKSSLSAYMNTYVVAFIWIMEQVNFIQYSSREYYNRSRFFTVQLKQFQSILIQYEFMRTLLLTSDVVIQQFISFCYTNFFESKFIVSLTFLLYSIVIDKSVSQIFVELVILCSNVCTVLLFTKIRKMITIIVWLSPASI